MAQAIHLNHGLNCDVCGNHNNVIDLQHVHPANIGIVVPLQNIIDVQQHLEEQNQIILHQATQLITKDIKIIQLENKNLEAEEKIKELEKNQSYFSMIKKSADKVVHKVAIAVLGSKEDDEK